MNDDEITLEFIRVVCVDPELDAAICRLFNLFAMELPWLDNGYSHHDGYRTTT